MTELNEKQIFAIVWSSLVFLVGVAFLGVLVKRGGKGVGAPLYRCLTVAVIFMIGNGAFATAHKFEHQMRKSRRANKALITLDHATSRIAIVACLYGFLTMWTTIHNMNLRIKRVLIPCITMVLTFMTMIMNIVAQAVVFSRDIPDNLLLTLAKSTEIAFRGEVLLLVMLPILSVTTLLIKNVLFPAHKFTGSVSDQWPFFNWRFIAIFSAACIWAVLEFALSVWTIYQSRENSNSFKWLYWSSIVFNFISILIMILLCCPQQLEKGAYEVMSFLRSLQVVDACSIPSIEGIEGASMSSAEDEERGVVYFTVPEGV